MTGEVSLTCDAGQAGNTDAYFAVTGHWIEERAPGEWTIEQALLGFVQMNMAHNGARVKKQPSQDILHGDEAEEELSLARLVSSYTLPHQNSQPGARGRQTARSKVLSRRARDT